MHLGESYVNYETCHEGYGVGTRNDAGGDILNFCIANGLAVVNTT